TGGSRRAVRSRAEKPAHAAPGREHGVHRRRRRLPTTWISRGGVMAPEHGGRGISLATGIALGIAIGAAIGVAMDNVALGLGRVSRSASPCRWRHPASARSGGTMRERAGTATTVDPDGQPAPASAVAHG